MAETIAPASLSLGTITQQNKHSFSPEIREVFEFVETHPEHLDFCAEKDRLAMRQYDRAVAQKIFSKVVETQADISLRDMLTLLLAALPDERDDNYVREHIQWCITSFEALAYKSKVLFG